MKAYTDSSRQFYLETDDPVLLTRTPGVHFAKSRPKDLRVLPDDDAVRVVEGFMKTAQRQGGDNLAIHYLKECYMSAKGNYLVVDLAALVIAAKFAFENEAADSVKEGGAHAGKTVLSEEAFGKLSVEQRCKLARPYLKEEEATKTPDGEAFAKQAWKVANRFKNPKPASGKTGSDGKTKETKPREKGVKTKIYELFSGKEGDDLHLSVDEIMAKVDGTRASVTTAISDLRSEKYAGKQGTLNLVRVDGKYSRAGSPAATKAQKAADEAAKKAEADKKAKAEAAKQAKDDAKKKEPAAAQA